MGIAVLPYEMHKEYFKVIDDNKKSEENRQKGLKAIQDSVKNNLEYSILKDYIMKLYSDNKWKTTYLGEFKRGSISEEIVVFGFLKHLRNAVCHSGDNAMSILPLTEGIMIERIMFYDHYNGQEFAMCISVEELRKLVRYVADFYCNTQIGSIDKTENIKNAEKRVAEILGLNYFT